MPKVKRDITHDPNSSLKDLDAEACINKYGDRLQPIVEKLRAELKSLGYELKIVTSKVDGKVEMMYSKR